MNLNEQLTKTQNQASVFMLWCQFCCQKSFIISGKWKKNYHFYKKKKCIESYLYQKFSFIWIKNHKKIYKMSYKNYRKKNFLWKIFSFFYINRTIEESISFVKTFDFLFLMDLHALQCLEYGFTISGNYVSVCVSVRQYSTDFVKI